MLPGPRADPVTHPTVVGLSALMAAAWLSLGAWIEVGFGSSAWRRSNHALAVASSCGVDMWPAGATAMLSLSGLQAHTWLRVRLPAVSRPDAPGRCARCGAQSRRVRVSVCRPGSGLERKVSTVEIVSEEVARPPRLFLTYSFHTR